MGISDLIANFLQDSLEEAENGVLEVQRSDLAQRFNCVPSQINYVMSTRFSPMMHVINTLGDRVDLPSARAILSNLVQSGALNEDVGQALLAAVGDKALGAVPRENRDAVRADIMKQVLILQV